MFDPTLQLADSLESLPNDKRSVFARLVENQFSQESALVLFDEGIQEETRGEVQWLESEMSHVLLTRSGKLDLESISLTKRPPVMDILASIANRINATNSYQLPRPNAFVFKEQFLRVVVKMEGNLVTVMAIANAQINPLRKIWRYFKQSRAESIIRSSELYFCRADLLTADPYECRLPVKVAERTRKALEFVYPGKSEGFVPSFELPRKSSYVCCWRMQEHESYLAWKHYCQQKEQDGTSAEGGFALQTTQRRMFHLHGKLRTSHDVYCRQVEYLDHWNDDLPSHDIGEVVFWKAYWFSDERELRLALLRHYPWSSSPDWNPSQLRKGEPVHVDLEALVETIVLNPFASNSQLEQLRKLIGEHRRQLESRVRESVILRKPPLEA